MSDQDVFNGNNNNNQETPGNNANNQNMFNEKLDDIKNDDGVKKYDSVDKALDALKASQEYIPQLQNENGVLREELAKLKEQMDNRESVEEMLNRMSNTQEPQQQQQTAQPAGLDQEGIAEVVRNQLQASQMEQVKNGNLNSVKDALESKFGEKAAEAVQLKANELGTTPEQLKKLSEDNPQLVLSLFNNQTNISSPTTPGMNSSFTQEPDTPKPPVNDKKIMRGGASWNDVMEKLQESKAYTNARLGVKE